MRIACDACGIEVRGESAPDRWNVLPRRRESDIIAAERARLLALSPKLMLTKEGWLMRREGNYRIMDAESEEMARVIVEDLLRSK